MIWIMTETAAAPTRVDRRRERTRNALIAAAQELLAEGRSNASIQEITDAADVGFGTFYNHFESKEALFTEAVESALDAWGVFRDEIVGGIEDPAEIFATSFRMSGRLQRQVPELVRVILNAGASILLTDRGLRPRAMADLKRGIASGQFTMQDPEAALMAVGGALLGLLQMLDANPSLDDAQVSDGFTEHVLLLLGLDADEAARIVALELPELPQIL